MCVMVILVVVAGIWLQNAAASLPEDDLGIPPIHIVQPGDTLWSIASRYDMHRGEAVHWIREINDITPAITPGQIIELWEVIY